MPTSQKPPNQAAASWLLAAWERMAMDGFFKIICVRGEPIGIEVHGTRSLLPNEELKRVHPERESEQ